MLDTTPDTPVFTDFQLDERVMEGLSAMNFRQPTPVQVHAIPAILHNKDLVACAQTGTGKTAAYLLPILHRILQHPSPDGINTIILAPTRELALQIDQQLEGLSYFASISSLAVYGGGDGASWDQQKNALVNGADIVIATPGRLIAHLNLGYVNVRHLQHLILDEADRMLDMGFYDDIMRIVRQLPLQRQTLLFSATMPPKIRELSRSILVNPEQINIAISRPAENVRQEAYSVYDTQKIPLLQHVLSGQDITSALVFSSTKHGVKAIEQALKRLRLPVRAIHSDLEQNERETVLRDFRNRVFPVLVATDILSRGIDIEGIQLVINYDVPQDAEDYIHRIGRTARAAATGAAITFVNEKDQRRFSRIEQFLGSEVTKISSPESLGEGPAYNPATAKKSNGRKPFQKKKKKKFTRKPNAS